MPPRFWTLGRRLRVHLHGFRKVFGEGAAQYPEIGRALAALERAVDADLPFWRKRKRAADVGASRVWTNRVAYLRRRVAELQRQRRALVDVSEDRSRERATPTSLLCKVALTSPSVSARGFARSLRELFG